MLSKLVSVTLAILAAAVVLAACGQSDRSSTFEKDAPRALASVRAAGDALLATMESAGSGPDAALAKQLEANKSQIVAANAGIKALDASDSAQRKLVEELSSALTSVSGDLATLIDSVSVSDASQAKAKTAQLMADAATVKAAYDALRKSVAGKD